MLFRGGVFSKLRVFKNKPKRLLLGKNLRLRSTKLISLGSRVKIGDNCRIECFSEIGSTTTTELIINANVNIGNNVHIGAIGKISIGKNCLLGSNILIIDHNHGSFKNIKERNNLPPKERPLIYKGEIIIEDNVWLCDNVTILGGSLIKKGSTVPAKSIVKGVFDNTTRY